MRDADVNTHTPHAHKHKENRLNSLETPSVSKNR